MRSSIKVLDWFSRDEFTPFDRGLRHVITMLACDERGDTVAVNVYVPLNFKVLPPSHLSESAAIQFLSALNDFVSDVDVSPVMGKSFQGFRDAQQTFYMLTFKNLRDFKRAKSLFRQSTLHEKVACELPSWVLEQRRSWKTFEADIPPVCHAMQFLNIPATSWVSVSDRWLTTSSGLTRCKTEYFVPDASHLQVMDIDRTPPFKIATFDIEVFSADSTYEEQIFPKAEKDHDVITQIVTMFSSFGERESYLTEALVLSKQPVQHDGIVVRCFDSERELIQAWADSYARDGVSATSTYNGLGFDFAYIYRRAEKLRVDLNILSRDKKTEVSLYEQTLESAGLGFNSFQSLVTPGMLHADVMVDIKRAYKLDSYKLEFCAPHFLKTVKKVDFKPQEQFDAFRSGEPEQLAKLLNYCYYDVKCTFLLEFKLNIIMNILATASVAWVTPTMCSTRGQQIRSYCCLLQEIKQQKVAYFLPDMKDDVSGVSTFQGATVLEPEKGYFSTPVVVADFASLYPSIIRTYNLSPETYVVPGTLAPSQSTVYLGETIVNKSKLSGILPAVLERLARCRKEAKKKMNRYEQMGYDAPVVTLQINVEDNEMKVNLTLSKLADEYHFKSSVYNAQQLALKVQMNSMYGTLGVKKFGLQQCLPLAALTTGLGRQLIDTTKKFFEAKIPGSRVIYGDTDSVMWLPFPDGEGNTDRKELLQRAFDVGKETCEEIKRDVFRREFHDTQIDLEFENIFCPYLLVGKKNYSALVWDDTFGVEKYKKMLNKGFRCVRRDVDAYTRCVLFSCSHTKTWEMDLFTHFSLCVLSSELTFIIFYIVFSCYHMQAITDRYTKESSRR